MCVYMVLLLLPVYHYPHRERARAREKYLKFMLTIMYIVLRDKKFYTRTHI